jgi:hypothetical protein
MTKSLFFFSTVRKKLRQRTDDSYGEVVDILGEPGVARQLAATASHSNTELTPTCGHISIYARGADIRYAIGSSAQTANASTSHFIADGERLDLALPDTPHIAVIRDTSATENGTLEVTELS